MKTTVKDAKELMTRPKNFALHNRYVTALREWWSKGTATPEQLLHEVDTAHLYIKAAHSDLGDALEDQYQAAKLLARALGDEESPLHGFAVEFAEWVQK